MNKLEKNTGQYCSFCGMSKEEVPLNHLVEGPVGFICESCVDLAKSIFDAIRKQATVAQEVEHAVDNRTT